MHAKGEFLAGDHPCGIVEVGMAKRNLVAVPPSILPDGFAMKRNRGGGAMWGLDRDWRLVHINLPRSTVPIAVSVR